MSIPDGARRDEIRCAQAGRSDGGSAQRNYHVSIPSIQKTHQEQTYSVVVYDVKASLCLYTSLLQPPILEEVPHKTHGLALPLPSVFTAVLLFQTPFSGIAEIRLRGLCGVCAYFQSIRIISIRAEECDIVPLSTAGDEDLPSLAAFYCLR